MKKPLKTILFFGNERLATGVSTDTLILKSLINIGYHIPAIIVSQDSGNKSRKNRELEIVDVARQNDIEILSYGSLKNAAPEIAKYKAEAAVLVAYGKIIPANILDLFNVGIINVHPSLLPKHRGPTPLESTLLGGDTETGVSIMKLSKEMDSGPVYAQERINLIGNETKQELADKLDQIGSNMLANVLDSIIDGSLMPKVQNENDATYDKLITKQDGEIDWKIPASQIERQIRAFATWPKSKTSLNGIEVTILEAHVESGEAQTGRVITEDNKLGVGTSKGILILDKLVPSGKKEMTGQSFLAGYKTRI